MKVEGKYLLGTVSEIAEYILRETVSKGTDGISNESEFKEWAFAIAVDWYEDYDALEDVASDSSGWYGIRKIDTGFNNCDLDLFADYYGGGCGVYRYLFDGMEVKDCIETVKEMIMHVLNDWDCCYEDTIIIAELQSSEDVSEKKEINDKL